MSDPIVTPPTSEAEIRALVAAIVAGGPDGEGAFERLRPLGPAVVRFLAEAYPQSRRWQGRAALVFHAVRYARVSEAAVELALAALEDKSYIVRYRACMVLAYGLSARSVPALQRAATHVDPRTAGDARAALDAIEHGNHHYFIDRTHSGQSYWEVNPGDVPWR